MFEYARKWWEGRNPLYTYSNYSEDCANFVSQCIYAGGMPMTAKWAFYKIAINNTIVSVFGKKVKKVTDAWGQAPELHKLIKKCAKNSSKVFKNYKEVSTQKQLKDAIKSGKYPEGSVGFIFNHKGKVYHSLFIGESTRDNIFYWAHSQNRNGLETNSQYGVKQIVDQGKKVALISINYCTEMKF